MTRRECTCAGTAPGYPQHESWCGQPDHEAVYVSEWALGVESDLKEAAMARADAAEAEVARLRGHIAAIRAKAENEMTMPATGAWHDGARAVAWWVLAELDPSNHADAAAECSPVPTEPQSMTWAEDIRSLEMVATVIVAWINANGGEAGYVNEGEWGQRIDPRIEVRTSDRWAYAKPGDTIVMGEEWLAGPESPLTADSFRVFTVEATR